MKQYVSSSLYWFLNRVSQEDQFFRIRNKWATASSQDFLQTTSYSNNQSWNKNIIDLIQHYTSYHSLMNYLLTTDYGLESIGLLSQYSALNILYKQR